MALQDLEVVDLAFDLRVAPMRQEGRLDSIAVGTQALGEAAKLALSAGGGFLQPPIEHLRTTPL